MSTSDFCATMPSPGLADRLGEARDRVQQRCAAELDHVEQHDRLTHAPVKLEQVDGLISDVGAGVAEEPLPPLGQMGATLCAPAPTEHAHDPELGTERLKALSMDEPAGWDMAVPALVVPALQTPSLRDGSGASRVGYKRSFAGVVAGKLEEAVGVAHAPKKPKGAKGYAPFPCVGFRLPEGSEPTMPAPTGLQKVGLMKGMRKAIRRNLMDQGKFAEKLERLKDQGGELKGIFGKGVVKDLEHVYRDRSGGFIYGGCFVHDSDGQNKRNGHIFMARIVQIARVVSSLRC